MFKKTIKYNGGMDKEEYYNTCEKCGRPFPKAKPCSCSCNFGTSEYKHKAKACIRNKNPECPYNAVIPSVTVETTDGISNLADCFVHVTSINTTFYIDDKHRIMTIWAGPVETTVPEDVQTEEQFEEFIKSFGLRSQYLYVKVHDSDNNQDVYQAFFFDKTGTGYYYGELYPIDNGGLI